MAKFDAHLKCSFCGKSQDQVRKLIAGPGVYICDECIDLCNEILDEELIDTQAKLTKDEFITSDKGRKDGQLLWGSEKGPFRFTKCIR